MSSQAQIPHPLFVTSPQLVERYRAKKVWAQDRWHLTSRWLRKVLSHTMTVLLCQTEPICRRCVSQSLLPTENLRIGLAR